MQETRRFVAITDDTDDSGKLFVIEKMHAEPLEDWGMRLLLGLARSKVDIPDGIEEGGIAGLVRYSLSGALSQISIEELRPLLKEMFACIKICPEPGNRDFSRDLVSNDIFDVKTRLKLRAHWIDLHTGFSIPGVTSPSTATPGTDGRSPTPSTRTSRGRSAR